MSHLPSTGPGSYSNVSQDGNFLPTMTQQPTPQNVQTQQVAQNQIAPGQIPPPMQNLQQQSVTQDPGVPMGSGQQTENQSQQHMHNPPQYNLEQASHQGPAPAYNQQISGQLQGGGDNQALQQPPAPSNTYQVTQAQLSPPVTDSQTATKATASIAKQKAKKFGKSIKKLFQNKDDTTRNIGFALNDKLVMAHHKTPPVDNFVRQFQVTKLRSWRTGYQRTLVLYDEDFATFDGVTETNRWRYQMLTEWMAIPDEESTMLLQVNDKLKLTTHEVSRSEVLLALLQQQDKSGQANTSQHVLWSSVQRYTRHGTTVPVRLVAKAFGICELDATTNKVLQTYGYNQIIGVSLISDQSSGIVLHFAGSTRYPKTRLYLLAANGRSELTAALQTKSEVLGLSLKMQASCTLQQWLAARRAWKLYPTKSWIVTKTTARHEFAVQRTLFVYDHVIEYDGAGIVSARSLADLISLVRRDSNVTLEFKFVTRTYHSSHSDALIVSLLDAAQSVGNNNVSVVNIDLAPFRLSWAIDKDLGSSKGMFATVPIAHACLKRVCSTSSQAYAFLSKQFENNATVSITDECRHVEHACKEFNASVPPTGFGLPNAEKDKVIVGTIGALWGLVSGLVVSEEGSTTKARFEAETVAACLLQTLFRLSQTTTGYRSSVDLTTLQECIPVLFRISDDFCKYWAFNVLLTLLSGLSPTRDKEIEFTNKRVILATGGATLINGLVAALLEPSGKVNENGRQAVSDLMLVVASDLLQSLLCSQHDTTNPEAFQALIGALSGEYRALLITLRSSTPYVIENTALLLHLLSTHSPSTALRIRDAALSSAIILKHFYLAIFSPLEGQRFLSRYLCSLWMSGPSSCDEKRLLRRMVPHGFLAYFNMPSLSKTEEGQLDQLERDAVEVNLEAAVEEGSGAGGTNTARLRKRMELANATATDKLAPENFRIFFHVLTQDHTMADLIWSQQTRRELRIALEAEIQYIEREADALGFDAIAWNHQQFRIRYPSLDNEVKVGDVYMRLWLQAGDAFIRSWEEPLRLFEHLFRRFLCEIDRNTKVTIMCIRCLERLYAIHASKIGPFTDVMILVQTMSSTKSIETQHRLLGLLGTLLGVSDNSTNGNSADVPENAEQLLNAESIGQLCQFVAWGHTNGTQVGNILTRVLDQEASSRAMLTDGSDSKPSGDLSSGAKVPAASDAHCPPVWFVASTSRVPPPPNLVRGPFRVSELIGIMSRGELSPFDLVTASQVDEYDMDTDSEAIVDESLVDTGKWKRLSEVWQLRWQLCTDGSGSGILTPSEVALLSLKSLKRLVDLHRSLDSSGVPYVPIPTAKRILCGLNYDSADSADAGAATLSILTQALLCNDSNVVSQTAILLRQLTTHNKVAMSKFYLTGVFFFLLNYTGSNFGALAELLHASHLNQHFRSGFAAAADEGEIPMKERSIIGNLLPQGLLFILVNYGPEKFAETFVASADTPEVIWTLDMRKHLIEMIRQHLGDFPLRLFQNNTAGYEYCPMPGVAYKRLEKEVFCHNYYLHNLCDEKRFPDWPIAEPVEVFRSCLEQFKQQVERDESAEEEALETARKTLGLSGGDGSKELRKSYRSLARKYHPDKNPGGRETFELIQSSYELLLPIVESGEKIQSYGENDGLDECARVAEGFSGGRSQMNMMHLLIKTQLLICQRYGQQMSRYRYPAYRILLDCMALPLSCQDLMKEDSPTKLLESSLLLPSRSEFMKTAASLLFRTCLVSPLNSEALIEESGVQSLVDLVHFYIEVVLVMKTQTTPEIAPIEEVLDTLSELVHTLAGIAFYESGLSALVNIRDSSCFLNSWRRCIDGTLCSEKNGRDILIRRYALEGVINMGKNSNTRDSLVGSGILWPMLLMALSFDPTLDSSIGGEGVDNSDDLGVSVASSNILARLSVRGLGMLSGLLVDAKENPNLVESLGVLLTPPIARMLRNQRTGEILRILNSNVEQASIIWNFSMRSQLEAKLKMIQRDRPDAICKSQQEELSLVGDFVYAELKNEPMIGGVYLRVFNKGGKDALTCIPNPTAFAEHLVYHIALALNSDILKEDWEKINVVCTPEDFTVTIPPSTSSKVFPMALGALGIIVKADALDDSISGSSLLPNAVLSLLHLPLKSELFEVGSELISILCPQLSFADSVAREGSIWRLFHLLERREAFEESTLGEDAEGSEIASNRKSRGWAFLESLSSSPSIANQILSSSYWIELLGVLVGFTEFTKVWSSRVGAAKTLSRLMWDPSTGPISGPLLQRFLPATLTVRLQEDPETMVKDFDGDFDTPELIWDQDMRQELRKELAVHVNECLTHRKCRLPNSSTYTLPATARVRFQKLENELYIGGVYVSRFLKEPTYALRDASVFLELLLHRWKTELENYTTDSQKTTTQESTALSNAGKNVLELVTSAIVFLCKVQDSLCGKLSQWGYMPCCLGFAGQSVRQELLGSPLLSAIRLLHVSANQMVNVESIALVGSNDGRGGVVDLTIQAINGAPLHPDSAFMIEMLKKVYIRALGDLRKARHGSKPSPAHPGAVTTAPSPAPGDGPVRRKVNIGDDPLGMGASAPVPSQTQPLGMRGPAPAPLQTQSSPGMRGPASVPLQNQPPLGMGAPASIPSQALFAQLGQNVNIQQQSYVQQRANFGGSQAFSLAQPPVGSYQTAQVGVMRPSQPHQQPVINQQHQPTFYGHMPRSAAPLPVSGTSASSQFHVQSQQPVTTGYGAQGYKGIANNQIGGDLPRAANASSALPGGSTFSTGAFNQTSHAGAHNNALLNSPPNVPGLAQDGRMQSREQTGQQFPGQAGFPTQQGLVRNQMPWQMQTQPNQQASSQPRDKLVHPTTITSQTQGNTMNTQISSSLPRVQQQQHQQLAGLAHPQQTLPVVQTVQTVEGVGVDNASRYEGSGIDARSKPDPTAAAEQQAVVIGGAPGAAQGRIALLQQAIKYNLCQFLVEKVLENEDLRSLKDAPGAKVHTIELLKLLTRDPGYGAKFKLVLDEFPAWGKYKSQDHSLLITGHEQKTDYFLTDGKSGEQTKLLKET